MIRLYKRIENLWFMINQKIRFLLVGGANTVFSYLFFIFLVEFLRINYQMSLFILYAVSINLSTFTMSYYVFRKSTNLKKTYAKAWLVYVSMILINSLALHIMVEFLGIIPVIAQAIYTIFSSILLFILHKKFTFT